MTKPFPFRVIAAAGLCLAGSAAAHAQTASEPKPQVAEDIFKNIQILKGVPVNEFLGIMGFFSASLGKSCVDCHDSDSGWENYISDNNPNKKTARRMIAMVNTLNKGSFGGRQAVTCYSCHRGGPSPKVTPDLTALYSPPEEPQSDVVKKAPTGPTADQILDKYLQAVGGTQKLAGLTSYAAKGTSIGYGLDAEKRPVEIYAKATGPSLTVTDRTATIQRAAMVQRTTIVHAPEGDFTTAYDGRSAWIAAPNIPLPVLPLTGGDLEGAQLDAAIAFPAGIKQSLGDWRVGFDTEIDDDEVHVVQGTTAGGTMATFYFDPASGLLKRMVRYANSPVGRMPTRVDYSDYREVAGVKMPFKWTVTWLDGLETFEITDIQPNVAIDEEKFSKPAGAASAR
jgi:photosynthetic reaction center cytochrome c subunit